MITKKIKAFRTMTLTTRAQSVRLSPGEDTFVKFSCPAEFVSMLRSGLFVESVGDLKDIPVIRPPQGNINRAQQSVADTIKVIPPKERPVTAVEEMPLPSCKMCNTRMVLVSAENVDGVEESIFVCPKCQYEQTFPEKKVVVEEVPAVKEEEKVAEEVIPVIEKKKTKTAKKTLSEKVFED